MAMLSICCALHVGKFFAFLLYRLDRVRVVGVRIRVKVGNRNVRTLNTAFLNFTIKAIHRVYRVG